MVKKITIGRETYPVTEDAGFDHSVGMRRAHVETPHGEKVVVKRPGGAWRFWTPDDRTQPIREAVARGWPHNESK